MELFKFMFGNVEKEMKRELANLDELGIDELENINNPEILKEKLASYEYYTEDGEWYEINTINRIIE